MRQLRPAGSRGVLVEVDDLAAVLALHEQLRAAALPGVVDLVPAARTVLVVLDPGVADPATTAARIRALPPTPGPRAAGDGPAARDRDDLVEVPVVYDGEDLAHVGELTGWGTDGVVARHGATTWTVAFGGFVPGFGYCVADDGPTWSVPRRAGPRARVPAGAVALADAWTGVYPRASPGGWQLIGRTAAPLWDLDRDPPALLRAGATVRFVAVGADGGPAR